MRAAIAAGELDDAERWAEHAAAHAERLKLPAGVLRAATRLRGGRCSRAATRPGRRRSPRSGRARRARAELAQRGAPLDVLEARMVAGRALAAAGDAARPRRAAARRRRTPAAPARRALHEAAGRELRRLGSRVSAPTRRAARRDTTLSEREREIAALVSEGRSNKQVAATLYLSEKTIENALTTIYAKLGVRSRVELSLRFHLDRPAGVEQGVDDDHRGGRGGRRRRPRRAPPSRPRRRRPG